MRELKKGEIKIVPHILFKAQLPTCFRVNTLLQSIFFHEIKSSSKARVRSSCALLETLNTPPILRTPISKTSKH